MVFSSYLHPSYSFESTPGSLNKFSEPCTLIDLSILFSSSDAKQMKYGKILAYFVHVACDCGSCALAFISSISPRTEVGILLNGVIVLCM
ncbi:hypothetical protein L6452_32136 [Arctium lappa]|uniref:Uncharacterized protein n=1 Tax=Arctium lappa TaxID=4217 RepID=A0ACB8Z447_ARCLA|nr:hypothetical protein L6452_32136 [Arctium lappa]